MNYLVGYLTECPEFSSFNITNTSISYNGQVIDMTDFNIRKFIEKASKFKNSINTLSAEDVFKIIKIHVEFERMQKNSERKNKEAVKEIIAKTPSLNNLHPFTNKDAYQDEIEFLQYIDKNGEIHVLSHVSSSEILQVYMYLQSNNMEINEEAIFNMLASNHESILLEDYSKAEKRIGVSKEHLDNIREIEEKNNSQMENHSKVLGNEKYGIYLNNTDVRTIHFDENGNKVVEDHNIKENREGELNQDYIGTSLEEPLISFEEYQSIVLYSNNIYDNEERKVRNFEGFLQDVVAYKDYLSDDVLTIYYKYENFKSYLKTPLSDGNLPTTAKIDGKDTLERLNENEYLSMNFSTERKQQVVQTLSRRKKESGFIGTALYVAIIVVVGIVIGVIAIMAK